MKWIKVSIKEDKRETILMNSASSFLGLFMSRVAAATSMSQEIQGQVAS